MSFHLFPDTFGKGFPSELSAKRGVRSVSSRRSTLALPAEGRPGPSDDDDDVDDADDDDDDDF